MSGQPSLIAQLRPLVHQGFTNAELAAHWPKVKISTIRVTAAKLRKEPACRSGPLKQGARPMYMPVHIHDALATEALGRFGKNVGPNEMALRLLAIIVRDDLFSAILGDEA